MKEKKTGDGKICRARVSGSKRIEKKSDFTNSLEKPQGRGA